jgi:hypothetical protein
MSNNPIRYFFLFLLLSAFGCKEDPPIVPPPPPPPPIYKDTITVITEDVTHRSITVNIKTTSNNPKSTIKFFRIFNSNETQVTEYPITVSDTSIIDDNFGNGLQLNTTYTYYAVRIDSIGERKDSSNTRQATTLDTTSHNYTWQEFAFGEAGSVLYDVWGTDENNVYAVGTVLFNDTAYGVIKWNGNEWTPAKKIGGLQAIIGFSNSDIWTAGGGVWHFNGAESEEYTYRDPVITNNITYSSIWGTSSSNLYFGNVGGKIIHWNGIEAEVVYTNSDIVQVSDLDGYAADFIIGVGRGFTPPLLAVYYNGNSWNKLPIENDPSLNSVAIVSRNHIYFTGNGIFEMKWNNFYRIFASGYYIYDIEYNRQTGVTVAAGPFGGVYINNGLEWRNFQGQITTVDNDFVGIFLINNIIFCVGRNDTQAKIIIGKN